MIRCVKGGRGPIREAWETRLKMKRYMTGLAGLLLVAMGGPMGGTASAQTMSYASAGALIARSCGPSINKFCSNVNIGTGEMMPCLRRNQNEVPEACFDDFQLAQREIAQRLAAQANIFKACESSTRQFCPGVKPGDAYILNCLNKAQRVLRPACRRTLRDAGWQ
jgi:hypothetical protein